MATYAMSDIHGHKDAFDEMLEKISFSSDDVLYILGDIHDRGGQSGEMLLWAVDKAPSNVHFLLGNHEDMAYSALVRLVREHGLLCMEREAAWGRNGGWDTLRELAQVLDDEPGGQKVLAWVRKRLLPWIEELPLYEVVDVGGKKFMLVHGGFTPAFYEGTDSLEGAGWCDANPDFRARREMVEPGYGFGRQWSQDMLWQRVEWIVSGNAPMETVFGHTFIRDEALQKCASLGGVASSGGNGKIAHLGNKHGIDCGCAGSGRGGDVERALGCLRLDDMAEFYVPVPA